ncbi:MAG TPA: histidinol-phosphate transaminase [Syntrophales bacterium]|nr:histidinol-phosphate transaminase [Syntrophales bacterium]HQG33876.1 histidinol-phosphate transaminase [Syntrophales bacterium]HQI34941.1 histidinol-phosphate transaminase [Syntrophales bacterium]HQJ30663.1 histidinol-phosphate transaminase [Syntrophales bacterium]HRR46838.1 histidinol-phosphate transaminase [Syntrophales bacterium]
MEIVGLIRKEIREQRAYAVEETSCPIKLDANENPYNLPAELRRRLCDRLADIEFHRYPEAGSPSLRRRLATQLGVAADEIMVGNGSDEIIQILCTAMAGPTATVLLPFPTFVMYRIAAVNCGCRVREVPLDDACDLDLDAMLAAVRDVRPVLTFLSYPNNPTGNCFAGEKIAAIIAASPGIVVVDEAYFPFSGRTLLPWRERYPNLAILRTVSKAGLAALRVGFVVAARELIGELNKVRLPYNVNTLSQQLALACLDCGEIFDRHAREVVAGRELLAARLVGMPGIRLVESAANFLFFCCTFDVNRIWKYLLERGILVKVFPVLGNLRNCMRITVGSAEENEKFIKVFQEFIARQGV